MGYQIGSFNCQNFGAGYNKNVGAMAEIICAESFDIVALQEIRRREALDMLLYQLRRRSPDPWEGAVDGDPRVSDYAFLWNSRRMGLVETTTPYGTRTYRPRIYRQYRIDRRAGQTDLIRDPFYARFTPRGKPGGLPIEIRLLNAHIRYKKASAGGADSGLSAARMRKNEFDLLARGIYPKEADRRYGDFMPAYTILLGDFNLNLARSGLPGPYLEERITLFDNGRLQKQILTVQDQPTTLKMSRASGGPEEEPEEGFASNYDHFTYDAQRFRQAQVSVGRVNSVLSHCGGDFARHRREISDHVPIRMTLELGGSGPAQP